MGTRQDFSEVMELVFAGKLQPVLDREFPLAEAAAAHERLQSGEQLGKITLLHLRHETDPAAPPVWRNLVRSAGVNLLQCSTCYA